MYFCISKIDKHANLNNKIMSTTNLFQSVKKNLVSVIVALLVFGVFVYAIIGDVIGMQNAVSGYEYCKNLCDLCHEGSMLYFAVLMGAIIYLTYESKRYSVWSIRLFYVMGASALLYFFMVSFALDYVYQLVGDAYQKELPSLFRALYTGPICTFVICCFAMPKIVKDVMKLKEEQELTV